MATLQDSLVSSSSRRVRLRKRPDLAVRRHRYHGKTYWVVKEPVGLNYFRFHEEEYAILNMLDGETSLEEIKEEFEQNFTPQKITFQDLQHFIGSLHRSGLVIADASGQGRQLRQRRDEKKWKEILGKFTNIFALRWRGIDPDRMLAWLYPFCRWMYSPITVFFCVMLMVSAASLVLVQFEVFSSRLPTFHEFFGAHNWGYLFVTMGLVKVVHEFGHGLTCKHFGGECHEMGAMLLVFTPALYCNVSDSWMLPNKWHRVAIGVGGMYVEGVIASVSTFVWWFTEPGLLINQLCLSMMFICSVSTLLFNGNPLLRFDGYYILMDILEIPNLRQKSTELLKRFMVELCLGIEQPDNPFLPQQNRFWFGMYSIAAVMYRWIVVFSILLFLNAVLEPYGLKVIGRIIGGLGFFGLVVQPLIQLGKFFYTPGRMHKVKKHRVIATCCVAGAIIFFIALIPLPFHVDATFELEPAAVKRIYAKHQGILKNLAVAPGQKINEGEPVAELVDIDLQLSIVRLNGEIKQLDTELRMLRRQALINSDVLLRIPEINKIRDSKQTQLAVKLEESENLKILAPMTGIVYPAPSRSGQTGDGMLPQWSGSIFQGKNANAVLTPDDLICQIGSENKMEAVLVIDQGDIDIIDRAINDGMTPVVDMLFDAWPGKSYDGELGEMAQMNVRQASPALSSQHGGSLNTRTDSRGVPVPLSASFQARVPIDNDNGMFRVGLRGQAKIYTGWQPLWQRAWRLFQRTLNFEL
ncbi:MAG: putative peptide zinc metalloprotease protein [Pirellulaceae bacterium]|jgi:putative peptide zinc metalloprotease protein